MWGEDEVKGRAGVARERRPAGGERGSEDPNNNKTKMTAQAQGVICFYLARPSALISPNVISTIAALKFLRVLKGSVSLVSTNRAQAGWVPVDSRVLPGAQCQVYLVTHSAVIGRDSGAHQENKRRSLGPLLQSESVSSSLPHRSDRPTTAA